MTTETRSRILDDYEAFFLRDRPAWLTQHVPPKWWTGDAAGWEKLRGEAEAHLRGQTAVDFLAKLASGWRSHELATGRPDGDLIAAGSGTVVRAPAVSLPSGLIQQAQRVLRELFPARVKLDPIIGMRLELVAAGTEANEARARDVLAAAESALSQARAAQEAERRTEEGRPLLRVLRPFEAMGRSYKPGEYRIDPSRANQLDTWRQRMEASPGSIRHPRSWPPFEIAAANAAQGEATAAVSPWDDAPAPVQQPLAGEGGPAELAAVSPPPSRSQAE